eukprot:TRINITY_DN18703_c0_g1_i2.p1 TRINITY_DN18703_c0_g1~~TRINITY_DN18703_c0_g1_i2.p1  ORF type:complete len:331 (+),score=63.28 TRINITY_DN18703_c0_g1_i2:79-993(+)
MGACLESAGVCPCTTDAVNEVSTEVVLETSVAKLECMHGSIVAEPAPEPLPPSQGRLLGRTSSQELFCPGPSTAPCQLAAFGSSLRAGDANILELACHEAKLMEQREQAAAAPQQEPRIVQLEALYRGIEFEDGVWVTDVAASPNALSRDVEPSPSGAPSDEWAHLQSVLDDLHASLVELEAAADSREKRLASLGASQLAVSDVAGRMHNCFSNRGNPEVATKVEVSSSEVRNTVGNCQEQAVACVHEARAHRLDAVATDNNAAASNNLPLLSGRRCLTTVAAQWARDRGLDAERDPEDLYRLF